MKRFVIVPIALAALFFPIFALQAEKLSQPLPEAKVVSSALSEAVLSEPSLRTTIVSVRYPETLWKTYSVSADCAKVSKPLWSSVSSSGVRYEMIPISFSSDCAKDSLTVALSSSGARVAGSELNIPVLDRGSLFLSLSDLSDENLFVFARDSADAAKASAASAKKMLSSSWVTTKEIFQAFELTYRATSLNFRSHEAFSLVHAREGLRYEVPVGGKILPTSYPLIPGSLRPYRKDTTDGIHHGWDLMAPIGTPVRALADGMVVRVSSGFAWKDFNRIVRGAVSNDQKALNLDVFRGNQVWLKTSDGNVTFYSHLSAIAPDIVAGRMVSAGEILGNVGITGVPDKTYGNSHLHFEIQKNPHDGSDSKDPLSIMRWNWIGKDLDKDGVDAVSASLFIQ